jgi:hypothetical protein
VPNVFFRSKPSRIPPVEVRDRLSSALSEALGGVTIDVVVDDSGVVVARWDDGPAAGTVADVVAGVVNWEVRTPGAPAAKEGAPAVVLDRSLSDRALAVAVVRYRASSVRPYHSGSDKAVAALTELLEVDDPARSGYPVPDAMADLLLVADDPEALDERAGPDASRADRLAAKLELLGYDRLWHTAWSGVQ